MRWSVQRNAREAGTDATGRCWPAQGNKSISDYGGWIFEQAAHRAFRDNEFGVAVGKDHAAPLRVPGLVVSRVPPVVGRVFCRIEPGEHLVVHQDSVRGACVQGIVDNAGRACRRDVVGDRVTVHDGEAAPLEVIGRTIGGEIRVGSGHVGALEGAARIVRATKQVGVFCVGVKQLFDAEVRCRRGFAVRMPDRERFIAVGNIHTNGHSNLACV